MTMAFSCTVPQPDGGIQNIAVETGCSIIIIGANGSGKTRLGVHLENAITAKSVHRLSAQKSLALNDNLSVISLERANNMLWYGTPIDLVSARHATRQLDRKLKRLTLEARDLVSLESSYKSGFSAIDPVAMFQDVKAKLQQHIDARNLSEVLRLYDNKGLLAKAARILGLKDQKQMMEKVERLLGGKEGAEVRWALEAELPAITHVSSVSSFAS